MFHPTLRSTLVFSIAALTMGFGGLTLRAAAPSAPSNLVATVNGLNVTLTWTGSNNSPTAYILQAGFAPGQTAITVPLAPSATSFPASAAAGTYYVRIVAVNADGASAPSNEVTVVLSSGCAAPSPPGNLRAIIRGTEVFLFWRRPAVGTVTSYSVQAGTAPGQTFTQFCHLRHDAQRRRWRRQLCRARRGHRAVWQQRGLQRNLACVPQQHCTGR